MSKVDKLVEPKDLGAAGRDLWSRLTGKYEFRPDEVTLIERAARAADRISAMESELGDSLLSVGSTGQLAVHPLIPEIRAHTALVASLLKQLNLPDEDSASGESSRSTSARKAAQSRWAVAHGAAS